LTRFAVKIFVGIHDDAKFLTPCSAAVGIEQEKETTRKFQHHRAAATVEYSTTRKEVEVLIEYRRLSVLSL